MPRRSMAADLVNVATSAKLQEMDWTKNIEICELVARDHGQGKDIVKSIKKRLRHKNPYVQLFSVTLLEMLMNNCGEHVHKQVIDSGLLPILVKIVKKKDELPIRERIFLLLDATQTAVGGASGKFPQYYNAYYNLVSAGVQFPQSSHSNSTLANLRSTNVHANNSPIQDSVSIKCNGIMQQTTAQIAPDSSIIQKASSVMEVLLEVLGALNPQHPEGASDEFTLDLVEQCSFQKQRVMHLILTSRDEKMISQAIELNEKMHDVLTKHDALLSIRSPPGTTFINHEKPDNEDDLERLLDRIRKGKACAIDHPEISPGTIRPNQGDRLRLPIARPLCIEPLQSNGSNLHPVAPPVSNGSNLTTPMQAAIPPPPAKHREREMFFKEKQLDGVSGLSGHIRGLSLHSHDGSSSQSGSGD